MLALHYTCSCGSLSYCGAGAVDTRGKYKLSLDRAISLLYEKRPTDCWPTPLCVRTAKQQQTPSEHKRRTEPKVADISSDFTPTRVDYYPPLNVHAAHPTTASTVTNMLCQRVPQINVGHLPIERGAKCQRERSHRRRVNSGGGVRCQHSQNTYWYEVLRIRYNQTRSRTVCTSTRNTRDTERYSM